MGPDYPNRRAKLLRRLKTIEVDGLIISNPANVRYLTGFTGDSAWLFLNLTNCVILSDTRYATQLADECPDIDMEIRDSGSTMSVLAAKTVAKAGLKRLGIEADDITVAQFGSMSEKITTADLVATKWTCGAPARGQRQVGTGTNPAAIEYAQRGIGVVRSSLRLEQTETEIRYLLESAMRSFGASGTGFEPIVGVGPTAALPHAHAGTRRVSEHPCAA